MLKLNQQKRILTSTFLSVVLATQPLMAVENAPEDTSTTTSPVNVTVNQASGNTPVNVTTSSTQPNLRNSGLVAATQARDSQNIGKLVGIAGTALSSAMAIVHCLPTPKDPGKCTFWVVGIGLSVMTTTVMSKSKSKSQQAMNDLSVQQYTANKDEDPFDDDVSEFSRNEQPFVRESISQYRRAEVQLQKAGFVIDTNKGTVTTPDKKVIKLSDLKSGDTMKAAGYTSAEIASFKTMSDQLTKQSIEQVSKVAGADSSSSYDEGGGGAIASMSSTTDEMPNSGFTMPGLPREIATDGSANSETALGMSVKLSDGTPIGVSSASIFGALNERYNREQSKLLQPK